jgi:helix-hairpin-helix protein
MDRLAIAQLLREIGHLLEIQGGNPFKARAYARGTRALEALTADLDRLVAQNRLTEIPAVGPALAATIRDLHETGRSEQIDRLRAPRRAGATPGAGRRRAGVPAAACVAEPARQPRRRSSGPAYVRPAIRCRCIRKNTSTGGIAARMDAAATSDHAVCHMPRSD